MPAIADDSDDTLKLYLSKSDLVVSGRIVSEPIGMIEEAGVPYYFCDFKVQEIAKGDGTLKNQVIKVDIKRFEIDAKDKHPLIKKDGEYILFLKSSAPNTPSWVTTDFWFGVQYSSPWMIRSLRRLATEREVEQPGAAQPATKPADKPPVKVQPSPPHVEGQPPVAGWQARTFCQRRRNMKYLSTVLLVLLISGIGLDVIVRMNRIESRLQTIDARPLQEPISAMLRDMASNGQLITDAQAKEVSMEVWKLLWGTKHNVKVASCQWDERFKTWIVQIGIYDPKAGVTLGSGCAVTISEQGELEKVERCEAM